MCAGLALVTGLFGAGCGTGIPDTSPVHRARGATSVGDSALQRYSVEPPRPGAPPKEIVDGFLESLQTSPRNVTLSRAFLTPAAAESWRPTGSLTVYSNRSTVVQTSSRVIMTAASLGTVNTRGAWVTDKHPYRHTFAVVKSGGQWRISDPPPQLLVDVDYFDRYFTSESLYFFDAARQVLVPDPIHVLRGDSVATSLVRGLLRGPSAALSGVVQPIVTSNAELTLGVTINNGIADVPLTSDVLDLDASDRQLLAAQLVWTLRQVPEIAAIRITVDGTPFRIPGSAATIEIGNFAAYDPSGITTSRDLYGLQDDRMVTITSTSVSPVSGPVHRLNGRIAAFAVNLAGTNAAVITTGRQRLYFGGLMSPNGSVPRLWTADGVDLESPSWDRANRLWVVDRASGEPRLEVFDGGKKVPVDARGLDGTDVREIRVSRDGSRIAALVGAGTTAHVMIGQIVGTPGATRVEVIGVHRLVHAPDQIRSPTSLAWYSPTDLAVVADDAQGKPTPFIVSIDGATLGEASTYALPAVVSVDAGSNSEVPIVTSAPDHRVYSRGTDARWLAIGGDVRLTSVRYPG